MNEFTDSQKPECDLMVCSLTSGSKGNSIYVSDSKTSVLVDAGLSCKEIERRLRLRGLEPEDLDAILITHEHTDHIQAVGTLSRKYNLPVYINPKTHAACEDQLKKLYQTVCFESGMSFTLSSLKIHAFPISHDASDPVGYTISRNGTKVGIVTDIGVATSMVKVHLKDCNAIVLEANHDSEMLMNGPYPWHLKQRIKGRTGHLSNVQTRELLMEVEHDSLYHVVLAHLSETNNTPHHAIREVRQGLTRSHLRLTVATQEDGGEMIWVKSER